MIRLSDNVLECSGKLYRDKKRVMIVEVSELFKLHDILLVHGPRKSGGWQVDDLMGCYAMLGNVQMSLSL